MEKLKNSNYFSSEHNWKYTGSSQVHDFLKCEACAMAKLRGEWQEESSKAMIVSSYIDSVISNELEQFKEEHPDIFLKSGELKAEYKQADEVIEQMKQDEMFWKYVGKGKHQKIMTGTISNIPVKIKIDCLHDTCITDLKIIKDMDFLWDNEDKCKKNFVDFYKYTLQAALYQEVVYQRTGNRLPFIIAVATKEKYSQRALLQIDQEVMDRELEFLESYLPHLQDVKMGKVEPISCGKCDYCKSKQKTTRIWYYDEFFQENNK